MITVNEFFKNNLKGYKTTHTWCLFFKEITVGTDPKLRLQSSSPEYQVVPTRTEVAGGLRAVLFQPAGL